MTARDWLAQSPVTDPGRHAAAIDALLAGRAGGDVRATVAGVCDAVRGLVSHYVASGIDFPPERLAEVDTRWVESILGLILGRDPAPLAVARAPEERFVGCCRDYTALAVAALRRAGVPARSRVGFADYLSGSFRYDHVVVEYFDPAAAGGTGAWRRADAQVPDPFDGVDTRDLDAAGPRFRTASEVWLDHRAGRIDDEEILGYGVSPGSPLVGGWVVRAYVLLELAHLAGIETLLWDSWGAMTTRPLLPDDDHEPVDRVAAVLLDRDVPRATLEALLAEPGLDPRGSVPLAPGDRA